MSKVLKFVAYLYLKVLLLIGYDYFFERADILGRPESSVSIQNQRAMYAATTLLVMPILDTIIMALPIWLSLKQKGSMRWIMLTMTFAFEFLIYYFSLSDKQLTVDLILKSVFSILIFFAIYRKNLFQKPRPVN